MYFPRAPSHYDDNTKNAACLGRRVRARNFRLLCSEWPKRGRGYCWCRCRQAITPILMMDDALRSCGFFGLPTLTFLGMPVTIDSRASAEKLAYAGLARCISCSGRSFCHIDYGQARKILQPTRLAIHGRDDSRQSTGVTDGDNGNMPHSHRRPRQICWHILQMFLISPPRAS